jgi:hypothetical protein
MVQDRRLRSSFGSSLLHRLHLSVEVRPIDLRVAFELWDMGACDTLKVNRTSCVVSSTLWPSPGTHYSGQAG